jgi:NAD(P)-dependent dehydrogenase (short-subunit alcohol dehydrogenase family)
MATGDFLMGRQIRCNHIRVNVDLSGRVALVTGGTKGLGRGIANAFRDAGAHVLVCARNAPAEPLEHFVAADLRDPEAAKSVVSTALDTWSRLDIVVNNAGGAPPSPAADMSANFVSKVIGLNLLAPLYVAQAVYPTMAAQDEGGVIINIGSLSGHRPSPGSSAYGAAKAGLANLTATLAMEWAPKVRVNEVMVGYLETEQSGLFYGDEAGIARVAQTVPMQRLAQPADVAAACLYLASPGAAFITGASIAVHGGGEPPPFLSAVSHV